MLEAEIHKALQSVDLKSLPRDNVVEIHGSWDMSDQPGMYEGPSISLQDIDGEVYVTVGQYGDTEPVYNAPAVSFNHGRAAAAAAESVNSFMSDEEEDWSL